MGTERAQCGCRIGKNQAHGSSGLVRILFPEPQEAMRVPDPGSDRPDCVLGGFLCCRENVLDSVG